MRRQAKSFDSFDAEQRHQLRIDIKKLRYACEFFAGLVPKSRRGECKGFVGRVEEIQESLGKLNDIETARQLAAELGTAVDEEAVEREAQALLRMTGHSLKALRAMKPYWR